MIIPSIDLSKGKAVQLRQGRDKELERDDPIALAREFDRYGEVAVIDLDAAFGTGDNESLVRQLCAVADCRVGGGVRSVEKALQAIGAGARKVIVGTRAFTSTGVDEAFLGELGQAVGREKVIVAVDAYDGEVVTKGWGHRTGLRVTEVVELLGPHAGELLFTCVEREGLMRGTDLELVRQVVARAHMPVTVAGGIASSDEVARISALNAHVQLGMAIYTGAMSLPEAFSAAVNWDSGLVPTIACDPSGQVLMPAYSTRESLERTFATGNACYYSRSRQKVWMKGESSGNVQRLLRARMDCDRDALLFTVSQQGAACHTGNYSCFGGRHFSLEELQEVILSRLTNPTPGSYTAGLSDAEVRAKLLEEAGEVVDAKTRDEIVWEAADVLYFLTVLLAREKVPLEEVFGELRRRRLSSRPQANTSKEN
ncbi:MAG: phosphoribosyl-AMP cyclohydrolase [bacterium]|jgi:phosphoribosyl-ATP pyrophosphohydrolase/phosphoribosyl-AMP cyclohydrolase|nr:phosphoribosyl-AMP cyclohydrolase [candidate division KSB1 bacterium]MDH7561527.1 phosphoribosyl-AMP cyclohydrolase [bacterium]